MIQDAIGNMVPQQKQNDSLQQTTMSMAVNGYMVQKQTSVPDYIAQTNMALLVYVCQGPD